MYLHVANTDSPQSTGREQHIHQIQSKGRAHNSGKKNARCCPEVFLTGKVSFMVAASKILIMKMFF